MSSADNLGKHFGPRSGPTKCQALSGSKLFDTLMVFLKEFFKKVDFEKKNQQTTKKKHENLPRRQRVKTKASKLRLCSYVTLAFGSLLNILKMVNSLHAG